jgi:hypothetical protein
MLQLGDKDQVTALMTAESIVVGFLLAYSSLFNVRVVDVTHLPQPQSPVSTVLAGFLVYGLILTAFRSLLLLFESIRTADPCEGNFRAGYDLFLLVILGSGIYVVMNAVSVVHYARELCFVTPPEPDTLYLVAGVCFGLWILVLTMFTRLRTCQCAQCLRRKLGPRRREVAIALVLIDAFVGCWITNGAKCEIDSILLKSPVVLVPTILAASTVIALWILMLPEFKQERRKLET